jgi:hypothetical protein
MVNKPKAQGTAWETELVNSLSLDLGVQVVRLPEGGVYDRGDLSFEVAGTEVVIEARDRSSMQVHTATQKANRKATGALTALIWKRKILKPGNTVRSQVGRPVVVMPLHDWVELVKMAQTGRQEI